MIVKWKEIAEILRQRVHVLLYGKPGFGKSFVGAVDQFSKIILTEETPAAEIRGHYLPDANGGFRFHYGPGIVAWKTGTRLIADEIDKASGDALTFCLALLDDPETARLTLPSGEVVRPEPGFHCIATMNGMPSDLPAPLLDRFAVRIEVDELSDGALQRLPEALRSIAPQTIAEDSDRQVSYRQWLSYARLCEALPQDMAARAVFGDRATEIVSAFKLAESVSGWHR